MEKEKIRKNKGVKTKPSVGNSSEIILTYLIPNVVINLENKKAKAIRESGLGNKKEKGSKMVALFQDSIYNDGLRHKET